MVHMSSSYLLMLLIIASLHAVLGNAGCDAPPWNDSSEWFSFSYYKEQAGRMFFPSSPVF